MQVEASIDKHTNTEQVLAVGDETIEKVVNNVTMKEAAHVSNETVQNNTTPETFSEAMTVIHAKEWKKLWDSEAQSIKALNVNKIVDVPKGQNHIDTKWVFKIQENEAG